jgi:hypothetical protein
MEKKTRNVLIILPILLTVLSGGFLALCPFPVPPAAEIKAALHSLSCASAKQADHYTPGLYKQALASCDSAMAVWKKENKKFICLRNYDLVKDYAILSAKLSDSANKKTSLLKTEMKDSQILAIDSLNKLVKNINEHYGAFPYPPPIRERISRGKMLLRDAETAFDAGNFIGADSCITESENLLMSSREFADINLREYFQSFPRWKRWIDITLSESVKTGSYSIIVDKFARKLILYHGGKKIKEYSAELGKYWIGNKRISGDMATPEGMYKIVRKLEGTATKYHKALLIDYPNNEDIERFKKDIRNGTLPPSADIGGSIEIHGGGGRGADWTEGCIALTDNDIDAVFRHIKNGTPVTIVGSLYDQKKIFEE